MADLRLVRGDTYSLPFAITDSNDDAVNLTSYTVWFTMKYQTADLDAAAVMQLETGSGISITSAAGGTGTIDIAASDWATYSTGKNLVWDLQIKHTDGTVTTVDSGRVLVTQDVTITTT